MVFSMYAAPMVAYRQLQGKSFAEVLLVVSLARQFPPKCDLHPSTLGTASTEVLVLFPAIAKHNEKETSMTCHCAGIAPTYPVNTT